MDVTTPNTKAGELSPAMDTVPVDLEAPPAPKARLFYLDNLKVSLMPSCPSFPSSRSSPRRQRSIPKVALAPSSRRLHHQLPMLHHPIGAIPRAMIERRGRPRLAQAPISRARAHDTP